MIKQDTFPATVALAASDFPMAIQDMTSQPPSPGAAPVVTARVVLSESRIWVVRDQPAGPMVVFSEAIDPSTHVKNSDASAKDSYVTTVSGKKVVWRKDSSCGCGSRLRTWRPYKYMSSINDPGPDDE
jgi:hypothetical protein